MDHILEFTEENDRAYFECSCGRGGSGDPFTIDIQAEKHIDFDVDYVKYRYPGM